MSTILMDHHDRDQATSTQQEIRKYWGRKKRTHRQMLKDKKDTSTSGKFGIGCDEDLYSTEKAYSDTTIIGRKVVAYVHDLTKHTSNEDNKVVLNRILNDPSTRELVDYDSLNSILTSVLVNNLRNSFVNMTKSEDDLFLKRSSLMMLLNSDVDDLNISVLSKVIGVSRKSVYNTINRLISRGEGSSLP